MVRRGSKLGVATVVPLIVGAVLTALAVSRHTYEAEATLFTSTSTENVAAPAPDTSAVSDQVRARVPSSAAEADRVQLVPEPGTYLVRLVARDQQPVAAAQRANGAAQGLVDAGAAHSPT